LNSQKREEQKSPCPLANPFHKLSMMSIVWNISIGQLGHLSGCAPLQLVQTCSLAEYEKLEKVLDFIATTKSIRVINILFVLNPKHSSYWEEN